MTLYYLNDIDPLATCNDGSPAGYYFAEGSGSSANLWIVYLEGSMFCWDLKSCTERYATHFYWMSSSAAPGWATSFAQGGIFATDGTSAWGNANRVYVKCVHFSGLPVPPGADTLRDRYCTSDLWSGDAPASESTFNFSFRGSRVPTAVVQSLMQTHGLGGAPGSRLLFGGCSAGAIGAMNNLERVAALVASKGVQTWGFLDGAGLLDIQPRGWTWSPLLETLQSLMANMTAFSQPVFQPYCSTSFPGEEYKCLLGAQRRCV